MDQHFNGPVGQVAGGNIHNYGPVTWDQLPTDQLLEQEKNWKQLLWAARRRHFFNLPLLFTILGFLGLAAFALNQFSQLGSGNFGSSGGYSYWGFLVYVIFCVGVPVHFMQKKMSREGAIIYEARSQLRGIDRALNRRGAR